MRDPHWHRREWSVASRGRSKMQITSNTKVSSSGAPLKVRTSRTSQADVVSVSASQIDCTSTLLPQP